MTRLHETDLRWFRRTAKWHAPVLDPVLPRLTGSANKSVLWSVIALLLHRFGGRFGRRAGLRGMVGLAFTSIVGNFIALIFRRQRPKIDDVPSIRRLKRLPESPSFPSRHSASAFAFATGVALEKPLIGVPVFALAAAVAYSRVYVGVHYPSDVIAGAALGTGLSLATRRLWPVAPDEPARGRPETVEWNDLPESDGTGLSIVVNPKAGTGFSGPPSDELREALPGAEIIETSEELTIDEALEKAAADGRAIGICGGDGSVNAAAHVAWKNEKPLVVIPGGTLNHFARDIGVTSVEDAIEAVRNPTPVGVDVGMIGDRPFLNVASIGSYVELVDARERLEKSIGKWPAVAVALVRVLRHSEPLQIQIDGEDQSIWMAFIGNCRYNPPGFTPTWRSRLDDGVIDLRIVDASHPFGRTRLLWSVLTGTLARSKVYRATTTSDPIKVHSHLEELRLARDGETFTGGHRFEIKKADDRLVVLVPPSDD